MVVSTVSPCQCRQNPTRLLRARGFPALLPSMQAAPEPPRGCHSQQPCLGHSESTMALPGLPGLGVLALDAAEAEAAWLPLGLWSAPRVMVSAPRALRTPPARAGAWGVHGVVTSGHRLPRHIGAALGGKGQWVDMGLRGRVQLALGMWSPQAEATEWLETLVWMQRKKKLRTESSKEPSRKS